MREAPDAGRGCPPTVGAGCGPGMRSITEIGIEWKALLPSPEWDAVVAGNACRFFAGARWALRSRLLNVGI